MSKNITDNINTTVAKKKMCHNFRQYDSIYQIISVKEKEPTYLFVLPEFFPFYLVGGKGVIVINNGALT